MSASETGTSSAAMISPQGTANLPPRDERDLSLWFRAPIVATFVWIFFGVSGIFGYRMWWNSPMHPSFYPFAVVAFAAVLAYSIVLSLDIATGSQINFEFAGQKFNGASGPVVLWALSFLAIMYGFSLANAKDMFTYSGPLNPPLHQIK